MLIMPPLCPFGSSKSCGGHAWPSVSTSVVSNSLRADQLAWKDLIGWSSFRLGHHEMPEEVQEVSVQHGTQAEKKRSNDANLKTLEEDPYFWSTVLSKRIILHHFCWSHRKVAYLDRTKFPSSFHPAGCWSCRCPKARAKGVIFGWVWSYPDKIAFTQLQIQQGFPWYSIGNVASNTLNKVYI